MNNIIVNATATRSSGGLSILNQFIDNIPSDKEDFYYVFVHSSYKKKEKENVEYFIIDTSNWIDRIKWDEWGLNQWVKNKGINISLLISLQNTGVKTGVEIPQLIYYHQPLPLSDRKWNFFKKEERLFFLYKFFYSFFVSRYLKDNTNVVVQIPSIKKAFLNKFTVGENQVHVVRPNISKINYDVIESFNYLDNYIHFLYPATPLVYKNHIVIISALNELNNRNPKLLSNIRVHFTCQSMDDIVLYKKIKEYKLDEIIIFEGVVSFDKLLSYYKSTHALLFPSYIETFGLPLLEAAGAGAPIIVSDLSYARDVIGDYEGARFVKVHDVNSWCNAITDICSNHKRFQCYTQSSNNGWNDFFNLVNQFKIVNNNVAI